MRSHTRRSQRPRSLRAPNEDEQASARSVDERLAGQGDCQGSHASDATDRASITYHTNAYRQTRCWTVPIILAVVLSIAVFLISTPSSVLSHPFTESFFVTKSPVDSMGGAEDQSSSDNLRPHPQQKKAHNNNSITKKVVDLRAVLHHDSSPCYPHDEGKLRGRRAYEQSAAKEIELLNAFFFATNYSRQEQNYNPVAPLLLCLWEIDSLLHTSSGDPLFTAEEDMHLSLVLALLRGEEDAAISMNATQKHMPKAMKKAFAGASVGSAPWASSPCREFAHRVSNFINVPKISQKGIPQETDDGTAEPLSGTIAFEILSHLRTAANFNAETFFIRDHTSYSQSSFGDGTAKKTKADVDHSAHSPPSSQQVSNRRSRGKQVDCVSGTLRQIWPPATSSGGALKKRGLPSSGAVDKQVPTSDRFSSRVFALPTLAHPSCVAEQLIRELHEQAKASPHSGKEGEVPRPNNRNNDRKYTLNDDAPLPDDVDMFYKYPNAKLNCFKHGGHDPGVSRTSQSSSAETGNSDLNVHERSGYLNDASSIYESENDRHLLLKNVLYFRGILYIFDESQEDNEEKKNDGRSEPTSLVFNYAPSFSMIKGNWPQPIFGNLSVRRVALSSPEFGAAAVRASDDAFSASSSKDDSGGRSHSSSSFSSSTASLPFPPNVVAAIAERFLRTPSNAIKSVNALGDSTHTVALTNTDETDTARRATAVTAAARQHSTRILDVPVAYWQPPTDFNSHYHTLVELTMPAFQSILNFWESDTFSMEPRRINCRREHLRVRTTAEAVVQKKDTRHAFDLALSAYALRTLEDNPLLVIPPRYWAQFLHKSPSAEVKREGAERSKEKTDSTTFLSGDREDKDEDTSLSFVLPFSTLQAQPATLLLPPSLMITSRPVRAGFVKNFAPLKRSKKTKVGGGRGGGGRDTPPFASSLLSSSVTESFFEEINSARTCRYAPLSQYAVEDNSLWSTDYHHQSSQLVDKSDGSSRLGEKFSASAAAAKEDFNGARLRPGEDNCLNTMLGRLTTSVLGSGVGSDWGENGLGGGGVYGVAAHHHQFADPANLGALMGEASVGKIEQPSPVSEDVLSSKIASFNPPRSGSNKATLGAPARRRILLDPYSSYSSSSSASRQSPRREEAFFLRNLIVGNPTHCEPLWGPDPFYSEVLAQDQHLRGTLYTRRLFKKPFAASPRTDGWRGQGEGDPVGDSVREDSSSSSPLVLSSPSQLRSYDTFLASYTDCQRFLWSFRNYYLQALTPIVSVAATLPSRGGSVIRSHSADHRGKIGSKQEEEIVEGPTDKVNPAMEEEAFFYRELLALSPTARELQYHTDVQYKGSGQRREEPSSSFFFSKLLAAGPHLSDRGSRPVGEDKTLDLKQRYHNPKVVSPKPSLIPTIYDHPVNYGTAHTTVSGDGGGGRGGGRVEGGSRCAKASAAGGKEADDIVILFTSRKGDWARELTNDKFVVKKLEEHFANRGRELVEADEENSLSSFSKLFPSTVSLAKYRRALGRKYLSAKVLVKKFTDSKQLEHQLLHADQLDVNKTTLFIGNHGANYIPSLFLRPNAGVITMSFSTPGFYPFAVFPKWLHWRDIHIEQDCNRRLYRGKCKWSSGNNNDMAVSFPHQMGRLLELVDDVIVQQVLNPRGGLL